MYLARATIMSPLRGLFAAVSPQEFFPNGKLQICGTRRRIVGEVGLTLLWTAVSLIRRHVSASVLSNHSPPCLRKCSFQLVSCKSEHGDLFFAIVRRVPHI